MKVFIHCCRWIKSSSPLNPVFRSYFEFAVSSIDRVITETWVFSCCAEACVISSSPPLPKIVQAEKCDYSFWLGARGESRQHERKMCVCVWIPTVRSNFPSAGDDVSVGSACSSDPPALPTYPWPLPPQPNGTWIYRERAGKCSISLEMQMQTYLVQTVDSGWVQIRPVLLPKRERETISINLKVCLKMGRHQAEESTFLVRLVRYVVKDPLPASMINHLIYLSIYLAGF